MCSNVSTSTISTISPFDVETGLKEEVQLAVMHAASTNHTYFFREPQVLNFFNDSILPLLAHQREVRIWSAATATGDEAYTLAMLIAEAHGLRAGRELFLNSRHRHQRPRDQARRSPPSMACPILSKRQSIF